MKFEDTQQLRLLFVGITGIFHVANAHRKAKKQFPPVDYSAASAPAKDFWRWREPPADLQLEVLQREEVSSLLLTRKLPGQVFASVIAYGLFLGLLYLLIYSLATQGYMPELWMLPIFALIPLAVLNVGSYPVQIHLKPDEIIIVERYGIFLHRTKHFRRKKGFHVQGDLQSQFTMSTYQDEPHFILKLGRKRFLGLGLVQKYTLPYDQSQGSWITGGLQAWVRPKA